MLMEHIFQVHNWFNKLFHCLFNYFIDYCFDCTHPTVSICFLRPTQKKLITQYSSNPRRKRTSIGSHQKSEEAKLHATLVGTIILLLFLSRILSIYHKMWNGKTMFCDMWLKISLLVAKTFHTTRLLWKCAPGKHQSLCVYFWKACHNLPKSQHFMSIAKSFWITHIQSHIWETKIWLKWNPNMLARY